MYICMYIYVYVCIYSTQAFKRGRIQFENNQVSHLSITPPAPSDSTETMVHIETQDDKKNTVPRKKIRSPQ